MNFGRHSADVRDLIDFILSGSLLHNPQPPHDPGLRIIRDLGEAYRYQEVQEDSPDGWWTWREILDYAGARGSDLPAQRLDRLKSVPGLMKSLAHLMDGEVYESLHRQLRENYGEDSILDIWGDLDFIIRYRATFGQTLAFIERLIALYRLGGYPCGWDGVYPEGRLVVFFPPAEGDTTSQSSPPGEHERAEPAQKEVKSRVAPGDDVPAVGEVR